MPPSPAARATSATNGEMPWCVASTPAPRIRAQHGEVAVGEVDDPHDAEHQRQPAGEDRVVPAEEHALDDLVDPGHASPPLVPPPEAEVRLDDLLARQVAARALPARSGPRACSTIRFETAIARPRSCSTSSDRRSRLDQRPQATGRPPSTAIGASPSDTSSSSRRRGFVISARPIAVACCSPPDRLPARFRRSGSSIGKASQTASTVHRPRRPLARGERQVLLDGQPGEQPAPLGHERDPRADALGRPAPT